MWIGKTLKNKFFQIPSDTNQRLALGFGMIILFSIFLGIFLEKYVLMAIPMLFLVGYVVIVDYKKLFFLMLFLIPFSDAYPIFGGMSLDLPAEPLIVALMFIFGLFSLVNWKKFNIGFLKSPITLLLIIHLTWMFLTVVFSQNIMVSLKFFLSKLWYVVVFYFMTGYVLKTKKDYKQFFWFSFWGIFITVLVILFRHALHGFTFKSVNFILQPFYSNHVKYSTLLALFTPMIWWAIKWYKKFSLIWWFLVFALGVFVLGVQFSYTRASILSIPMAIGAYFIIKYRFLKLAVYVSMVAAVIGIYFLVANNKYLDYAPNFETTITHQSFDELVNATYEGKDISTMERVYRWVAGGFMVRERPFLGFGPGNFYNFYTFFTVSSFKTNVSDNPEKSGTHCYYLMTATEQGVIGFLIFLMLNITILFQGESAYHSTTNPDQKRMIMAALLGLIIITAHLIINDMIETIETGSFFFIFASMIVINQLKEKDTDTLTEHSS